MNFVGSLIAFETTATAQRPAAFRTLSLRLFLTLACLMAAAGFAPPVSAQDEAGDDDGKTELLLWGVGARERPQGQRRPEPNYVQMFQEQNPDIRVINGSSLKVEGGPGEGAELMAIAGGTAPDVFDLFGRKLQTYAQSGFLEPLDRYLEQYEKEHGEPYEGIHAPSAIWEACKYNGQYMAVPRAFYTMQLYWRKDLLRRAGVDADVAPKDWDELFKIGMALTEPEGEVVIAGKRVKGSRYGFLLYGRAWPFMNFIWSAGGDVVRAYEEQPDGELLPLPRRKINFREDHIHVSDAETYYQQGFDLASSMYGEDLGKTDFQMWNDIESDAIEYRVVFNEPAAMEAFRFYEKLIHQPWTRCTTAHPGGEWDEFEITGVMRSEGGATCPVCGTEYGIAELQRTGRYYEGIASVQRETDPDIMDQFVRGRAAMMICWSGAAEGFVAKGLAKELVGQAPMPPGPSGKRANFIAGGFWAINSQSSRESQDAAWRYIEFITGKEMGLMRMRHAVETGTAIFAWPSDLQRYGFTDVLREIPKAWIDVEKELLANARVEPYNPGFQHVYQQIDIPLEKIEQAEHLGDVDIEETADNVVHYINTEIMSEPPPEVMARRNWIASILAILLLGFFVVMFAKAIKTLAGSDPASHQMEGPVQSGSHKRRVLIYSTLFLGLALGLTFVWRYIPLALGTTMAFFDWQLVRDSEFIWFQNFAAALFSREFWMTMLRTLQYVALSVSMGFVAPIILAIFLHEVPRFKMLFRTLYYLPAVTSGLVTMFLWKRALYDPTEEGLLNKIYLGTVNSISEWLNAVFAYLEILSAWFAFAYFQFRTGIELAPWVKDWFFSFFFGMLPRTPLVEPLQWLQDPKLAMFCIVLTGVWAGAGPGCLIYLAALKGVPEEEYEAAEIDGAGLLHKLFFITLPNLSALIIINFVGVFIASFQAMQNIFVMTGGGPQRATYTIGIDIWYNAFMYLKFGYATAMAWILGSLLIGFTVYQLRILKKVEFKAHGAGAA